MSNKQKYIALHGGKECKPVNPYCATDPIMGTSAEYLQRIKSLYDDFEANNPVLPLTEVMPEGETFEGIEVLQCRNKYEWCDEPEDFIWRIVTTEPEASCAFETRIAIKPLKGIEPEHPTLEEMVNHTMNRMSSLDGLERLPVDAVENKEERVEDLALRLYPVEMDDDDRGNEWDDNLNPRIAFIEGYNLKQSQSIEGIVGFAIDYIIDNASPDPFTGGIYKEQLEEFKSDIIKEYNNGK